MRTGVNVSYGPVTIKGNDQIRIGDYVRFLSNDARPYVVGLTQTFRQGTGADDGHFITKLGLERGRGYLVDSGGVG